MVTYFEIFYDFPQNQNGIRQIFVPLIRGLNAKTDLGGTLKSSFEAFPGWPRTSRN